MPGRAAAIAAQAAIVSPEPSKLEFSLFAGARRRPFVFKLMSDVLLMPAKRRKIGSSGRPERKQLTRELKIYSAASFALSLAPPLKIVEMENFAIRVARERPCLFRSGAPALSINRLYGNWISIQFIELMCCAWRFHCVALQRQE